MKSELMIEIVRKGDKYDLYLVRDYDCFSVIYDKKLGIKNPSYTLFGWSCLLGDYNINKNLLNFEGEMYTYIVKRT